MKVLVTGANGFIAGHTIEALRERGHIPVGLIRSIGQVENDMPDFIHIADIRDKEAVENAVAKTDGVINLAGILGTQETVNNPYPSVQVNVFGALNVFEAARIWKVPVVQIAVGNYWEKNSYSLSKTCAEGFGQMYAQYNDVTVTVVRALNAFGERQKAYPVRKIIASFITRVLDGKDIEIYGDGSQKMDMVYVKDVANILVDTLEKPQSGQVLEAGTGQGLSVKEIAEKIIKYSGKNVGIQYLPMRPGETPGSEVIAKNPYPYEYTDFDTAIQKTIAWYKS